MTTTDAHPLRILLVDDDQDDCDLFREALSETGIHSSFDYASDGVRLMERFNTPAESLPHLIFLDLNMPKIHGTECLREIRRASYLNGIPVIIFSTSFSNSDVEETFAGGANLYIQKPSNFIQLVDMLKKVLMLDWRKYTYERHRSQFFITARS